MHYSLETRTVSLSVGDFAGFSLGPQESGGGPQGLWRAQLGQHWHNELQKRTIAEFTTEGILHPDVKFELPIEGRLTHRGWHFDLNGRIDQLVPANCRAGSPALSPPNGPNPAISTVVLREIKSVTRPLPADEPTLRADYPAYFLQLAAYVVLSRPTAANPTLLAAPKPGEGGRAELVFVEAGSGLVQTVLLTPFDEALVFHQLDAIVEFLNLRLRAAERRRDLVFQPPFQSLRVGQETIQADLTAAFGSRVESPKSNDEGQPHGSSTFDVRPSTVLLFEAPTGYGKTGCVLEFALGQLKAGRFARLIWLTGKSTGQIQVMHTLRQMAAPSGGQEPSAKGKAPEVDPQVSGFRATAEAGRLVPGGQQAATGRSQVSAPGTPVPVWQVRNKSEHCVNHTFHCVRDGCSYLRDCAERWPGSGLSRFYTDERQARDLDTLRAAGRDAHICPYEITRAALSFHDVWVGDFNYVFAPDNRGLFFERPGFDPAETLLVVDEAHNLPSRVAGAYSHTATESDARLLLAELDHLGAPATLTLAVEEWVRLLGSLAPAESLDPGVEAEIHDLLERLAKFTADTQLDYAALGPQHCETFWQFPTLAGFLADPTLKKLLWVARAGQLEFTCVDASAAIGETLRQFGGALLMSATLQPYAEFAESCGLEVGRGLRSAPDNGGQGTDRPAYSTLHAPTPWRAGAYDVAVDLRVDTTFRNRANHYADTAATIVAMQAAACLDVRRRTADVSHQSSDAHPQVSGFRATAEAGRLVPGGQQAATGRSQVSTATPCVAVFFPSYAYAEAVMKTLNDYGSVLRVVLQPKLPDLAAQTAWVEENLVLSDVLFLVLGSSFAEGIDLLGGRVGHAIVVGPALPEVNAVQKAKLAALDHLGRDAAFRRVYQIPGLQKVNQALGRLVRAPGQKAKVLLHCRRFAEPSYASLLAADYQLYREIGSESDLRDWLGTPR